MKRTVICFACFVLLLLTACGDSGTDPNKGLPVIETLPVSQIELGIPNISIKIISPGDSPLTELALCWGENPNPDLSGDHYDLDPYYDEYPYTMSHTLYGLEPGAKVYVRSYAKNEHGEVWGNEISFTMLPMHWDVIDLGQNFTINSIHFHDANNGWLCGSNGQVKQSIDGGMTWFDVNTGTNSYLSDMFWLDTNTGWIVGSQNTVLRTTSGGRSWQLIDAGTVESEQFSGVYFEDTSTGYLVSIYGAVIKTTDGGESWTQIRNEGTLCFNEIWAQGSTIIMFGQGLRISNDGGETWTTGLNTNHEYYGYFYREPGFMWVVGEDSDTGDGKVYRTEDMGQTWSLIKHLCDYTINEICAAPGSSKMWFVGDYGSIYSSTNDGLSWTMNYNLLGSVMFKTICAVDENTVWIGGSLGRLLKLKTAESQ
ncbi:MAG: YCF48-related protein [Candidatus Cloacimonetes bacterium]|jgi:photosystem II stability/assembly factor-like uncharacterized protein|nr:YCF48-related protein [Candidatus Cloacimonadota bacterium]MDD2506237.1 YCF48-related protein [Candidatus Cloacimonadota bacterium]MDD4147486.1 YCF48-related protein [Candidatus Cloacimonadota bacterium]MDD4559747.1 YCF48-related protein [Candidatus Cloacimonadota bacterium]